MGRLNKAQCSDELSSLCSWLVQDRVTDHRVGITLHGLGDLMSGGEASAGQGQLDSIINALEVADQSRQLEQMSLGT